MLKFPFFRKKDNKNKRGALSIEMLGVLAIISMVIAFAANQGSQTRQATQAAALAHQLNILSKGAQHYLDANASALLDELNQTGTNHLLVTFNSENPSNAGVFRNSGGSKLTKPAASTSGMYDGLNPYMPVNFKRTNFEQIVKLYVYKGKDGMVNGMVGTTPDPNTIKPSYVAALSNPDTHEYANYKSVANQVSGMTGFGISNTTGKNLAGVSVQKGVIGNKGSWHFKYNDPNAGLVPPSAFENLQLARPLYAFSAAIKDDMLYRVEIAGHPELNAMDTDLHMNGWKLDNTGTIVISQNPEIQGAPGTYHDVDMYKGNGLRIEPYILRASNSDHSVLSGIGVRGGAEINQAAERICQEHYNDTTDPVRGNGHIFTIAYDTSGPGFQTPDDMNGIWMCMDGKPRLISDSKNSTATKSVRVMYDHETIEKPYCPTGTTPSIYLSEANFAEAKTRPAAVVAVQSYAEDLGDRWRVRIRLKTTKHVTGSAGTANAWKQDMYNDNLNYVVAHTTCERDIP